MAGIKIVDLPALGRNLASTDLFELSLAGGTGSRKITGQEIINAIPSGITIGTTAITSGTVGRVLFEGTGNVVSESANMTFDNATGVFQLTTTADNVFGLRLKSTTGQAKFKPYLNSTYGFLIESRNAADSALLPMSLSSNKLLLLDGNVVINSTSDNGAKLQITSGGATSATTSLTITNTSATRLLQIWDDGNIGINTTTNAGYKLDVNGTARVSGNLFVNTGSTPSSGLIIGDNTTASLLAYYSGGLYFKVLNTDAMTLTSGASGGLYIGSGGLQASYRLDVNGTARVVGNTLLDSGILATSAATTRLQGSLNYFSHNRLSSSGTYGFDIRQVGTTRSFWRYNDGSGNTEFGSNNYGIEFHGANAVRATLTAGGNFLINTTTDAGYLLDVNGIARIGSSSIGYSNALLSLTSDQGTFTMKVGGGAQLQCSSGISATVLSANDYISGVRVLLGGARINAPTTDWLSITNSSQSANGSGNLSVNLATFGTTYATINASAQVEIASTTKGFLPPRMTQAQRNAIASPAIGLEIYQTDATEGKYIYKSAGWTYIG